MDDDPLVIGAPPITREEMQRAMEIIRANSIPRGSIVHISRHETHWHEASGEHLGRARPL